MEEPNIAAVFACERHFSPLQKTAHGIRSNAVPDIPAISNVIVLPFRRKPKNWRKNVIVVTPRDPEFTIYRNETGVFPQNLFSNVEDTQPAAQMPVITSVSCSMSTQTNTRLCGLVQISDIKEEYRLNCFYCSEMFSIEKWSMFVKHLRIAHFQKEQAFKMSKYSSHDHDYTSYLSSNDESTVKSPIKFNTIKSNVNLLPQQTLPKAIGSIYRNGSKLSVIRPDIVKSANTPGNIVSQVLLLPQQHQQSPLLAKPIKHVESPLQKCINKMPEITPPLMHINFEEANSKTFNIGMADQVIKLLNETLLSPNFLQTEEDNILIIKNTGSVNIEASTFLKDIMNSDGEFSVPTQKKKTTNSSITSSKYTRPVYTINKGLQDVPSKRYSLPHLLFPPLPKNQKAKLVQKRIAQQTLKNINIFESIYKTVKIRPPRVVEIAHANEPDVGSSKATTDQEMLKLTPLNRCLKRTITETTDTIKPVPKTSTEIVFEYTPTDIVISLLDNMKNYPVLWEFHDQPFNKDYNRAIEQLCRIINYKWSLNINALKMKRSLNRIFRFYRYKLPSESIDEFEDYFDKCALFLPSVPDEIPRARCAYCCICYNKDVDLRRHMMLQHKSLKWPYKCLKCFERFRESDACELHKRLPHYEEVFKCEICFKRFNRRHLLNRHFATHVKTKERRQEAEKRRNLSQQPVVSHDAPIIIEEERGKKEDYEELQDFACEVCKKTFRTIAYLKCHIQACHEEKAFKCHLCPKEFCQKIQLKSHIKRHNNIFDYVCEVCGKGFNRMASLNEHMKKHTGDKITCNICNLKLRKCNLLRHLRLVHIVAEGTIESTYRAKSYRYQKFISPMRPYRRRRIVNERHYQCKVCSITFDRLKHLKDHNKLVHFDVKRVRCQLCTVEFLHVSNLKRHYRDKHKLHSYQVFQLVDVKVDLDTVLAMNSKELDSLMPFERPKNIKESDSYFEQEMVHSDQIQDEIMKAVESLDNQEIRVDDDHSMNEFFTDLLKQ